MISRVHERRLRELLDSFPVVAVIGPRQVGKSTLVQTGPELAERHYVTLDDFEVLGVAEKDPRVLLAGQRRITVDEVQRCPGLLRAIKAEVDCHREPGRFLLTGSCDLTMTANLAGELAGRVGVLTLPPFTWRELEGRLAPPAWLKWIDTPRIEDIEAEWPVAAPMHPDLEVMHMGGYPLSVTATDERARRDWFAAYRFTYLERDVRQKGHNAAIRSLAFKWIRVIHRCWQTHTPYDEARYLQALELRGSPLCRLIAAPDREAS